MVFELGKKDLLVGTERAGVLFYRNVGTASEPKLAPAETLALPAEGLKGTSRQRIDVVDWNNDGKLDVLVGNFYSNREPRAMGGNVWLFLAK